MISLLWWIIYNWNNELKQTLSSLNRLCHDLIRPRRSKTNIDRYHVQQRCLGKVADPSARQNKVEQVQLKMYEFFIFEFLSLIFGTVGDYNRKKKKRKVSLWSRRSNGLGSREFQGSF